MKRNAYSYIRFSSQAQAQGDSFRRQMARTVEFCEKHDLILNDTRYEDLGVSGWTGENMERGALGDFLHAVKSNKIEKGSLLILENWDRFSRLKPRVAYNKLAEIIEHGVDVVTLEDGKIHTKETLDDFATLVSSFAVMQRANEESSRKSDVVGAAWAAKRKAVAAGKEILTAHCPAWLRLKADKTGFELIPERFKVLKRIFRLVKEGKGKREIARTLDGEGVPPWSRGEHWRDNYILELIKSRTLLGELHPLRRKQPDSEPIKGYYPAAIDEETWTAIQPRKREFAAGPQSVVNLFSGLLHDGYHPDYLMKVTASSRDKNYIYMQSDYHAVDPLFTQWQKEIKAGRKAGPRPFSSEGFRYGEFERHFLEHFEDIDFHAILPNKPVVETGRVDHLQAEKKANEKALANLIKALETGEESAVVMGQIKKREAAAGRLAREVAVETQRLKAERHAVDSFQEEQERLTELMAGSSREARLALRALFHRIIERIDFFVAGLFEVPSDLKVHVDPKHYGMTCYSVTLVGGYKMWIWWDGLQIWEEPNPPKPA